MSTAVSFYPKAIPNSLRMLKQWVCWRLEERNGRNTKVPYDARTGRMASTTNAKTWTDFSTALKAYEAKSAFYSGIGFVFSKTDPFVGFDFDDCIDETGEFKPQIKALINGLDSYTEISPSGRGVKIIARGKLPTEESGRKNVSAGVEVYQHSRYFTLTGDVIEEPSRSVEERQEALDGVWSQFFSKHDPPKMDAIPAPSTNGTFSKCVSEMLKIKPIDKSDGSRRLFTVACRTVEHNLAELEAVRAIRIYEQVQPFPTQYTDDQILKRIRDAEKKTRRGVAAESSVKRPLSEGRGFADILADLRGHVKSNTPIVETLPCGWGLIDETMGGLVRGEMVGLVGSPGSGKTTHADQLVIGALKRTPNTTAIIFSLETHPKVRAARVAAGLCVAISDNGCIQNAVPIGRLLRGELNPNGQAVALGAIDKLTNEYGERLKFIDDANGVDEIAGVIRTEKPDVMLLDHLGLVQVPDGRDSEVSRMDEALAVIIAAIRHANTAAIIINEVNKVALKADRMDLSTSRGTARFGSLVAAFIGLSRTAPELPYKDPEVVAYLAKSRFGQSDMEQRARFYGGLAHFAWGPVRQTGEEENSKDA